MVVDLRLGDCLELMRELPPIDAVVADPPYGMNWDTNTKRVSGGVSPFICRRDGDGRDDWGAIINDDKPFDPTPWLAYRKVILWGANHYWRALPTGTTLVWIKKNDAMFGKFLSDAEIAWMKGGQGVYCFRKLFPPPSRMVEAGGTVAHPNQKPVALMCWCIERLKLPAGATILDPYMGSGTTGVAAVQLGYNFIGCEISPLYFARATERIAEAQMQPALEAVA